MFDTTTPPMFIGGIALYVHPDHPRMQLSPDCPVTDDFRKETNEWMREFFGVENVLKDGAIYIDQATKRHYCTPRTFETFKQAEKVQQAAEEFNDSIEHHLASVKAQAAKVPKVPDALKKRVSKHRKQMPRR